MTNTKLREQTREIVGSHEVRYPDGEQNNEEMNSATDEIITLFRTTLQEIVPKGTLHCENIAQAWCDDCLLEWRDTINANIKDILGGE